MLQDFKGAKTHLSELEVEMLSLHLTFRTSTGWGMPAYVCGGRHITAYCYTNDHAIKSEML